MTTATTTASSIYSPIAPTAAQMIQRIPTRGSRVMRDPLMGVEPAGLDRHVDDPDQMHFDELFPEYPRGPHVRRDP